jgi:uncharacterized membrane protein YraQ (UPF0718 family)
MAFVLGWNWVALRLVLGTLMVFGLGYFVNRMITSDEAKGIDQKLAGLANRPHSGLFARWFAILWRMAARLIPEYIILLLLLGAARAWLFPHMGPDIGNTIGWIVALAIAGTLFVIPTAGEVPIIQAMLALGVGVGPAGALLMTLPPISVPSVTMISRSFRPATLLFVTLSVVTFGIAGGLLAVIFGF